MEENVGISKKRVQKLLESLEHEKLDYNGDKNSGANHEYSKTKYYIPAQKNVFSYHSSNNQRIYCNDLKYCLVLHIFCRSSFLNCESNIQFRQIHLTKFLISKKCSDLTPVRRSVTHYYKIYVSMHHGALRCKDLIRSDPRPRVTGLHKSLQQYFLTNV